MTDRRRDQGYGQAGSAAYQRIMAKVEEGFDAVTARMEARLDRIDRDLGAREMDHQAISRELQEIRRDLGELRDGAAMQPDKTADKVVAATPPVVAPAVVASLPKTAWGKIVLIATAFTTLMVAINNIPDAVRGWNRLMIFLANEPAVVVRPIEDVKK